MEGMNYSTAIQDVLKQHLGHDSSSETKLQFICDTQNHHYQLVHLGWKGFKTSVWMYRPRRYFG